MRYQQCIQNTPTTLMPIPDERYRIPGITYGITYEVVSPQPGTILYRGMSVTRDRMNYGPRHYRWFSTADVALSYANCRLDDNYNDVYVQCVQVKNNLELFPLIDNDAIIRLSNNLNFDVVAYAVKFDMELVGDVHDVGGAYHVELPPYNRLTYIGDSKEFLNRVSTKKEDLQAAGEIIGTGYHGWYSREIPRKSPTGCWFPAEILLDMNLNLNSFFIQTTRSMTSNEVRLIAENAFSITSGGGQLNQFIDITPNKKEYEIIRKKASKMKPRNTVTIPKEIMWR